VHYNGSQNWVKTFQTRVYCQVSTFAMSDAEPCTEPIQQHHIDAFLAEIHANHQQFLQNQEEENNLFVAKAERLWGGQHVVNPDLQRFDSQDSIELIITPDQWECDDWLKVSHKYGYAFLQ
jgi:hypothetical protein